MTQIKESSSYKQAGVDIAKKMQFVQGLAGRVKKTDRPGVLGKIGGFGGLFGVSECGYKDPVLVTSVDGVGTKIKVAVMMGRHDTVGIDIVSHCANDIVVQGAEPLFFFDYIGMGKMEPGMADSIVDGLVEGCQQVGCALLGGETAEMPGVYPAGEYDLVGTIVGMVERDQIIDGSKIESGDQLIGFPSTGLHTNGYSLARKALLDNGKYQVKSNVDVLGTTVGEALLAPHKAYSKEILTLMKDFKIHGMSHITGGGFFDNIPRVLPDNVKVVIEKGSWPNLPIFELIQKEGNVSEEEMFHVFNMGIGMVVVVSQNEADRFLKSSQECGIQSVRIGEVQTGCKEVELK